MFYQNYTIVHFGRINLKKCSVRDLKISTNILKVVPNKCLERERKIYTYNGCSKVSDQNHFRIYFYVLLLICSLPSFSLLSLILESSEILNVKFQINYVFNMAIEILHNQSTSYFISITHQCFTQSFHGRPPQILISHG